MRRAVLVGVVLVACRGGAPVGPPVWPEDPGAPPVDGGSDDAPPPPPPRITWARVDAPADVPGTPPAPGTWRLHLIDVGTGLSVLVQGADFAMLYDAGSGDPAERPSRVVAYLGAALGTSGDEQCTSAGAPAAAHRTIDHVVLSHPHLDHGSALDLVLHCYRAAHVWDSGRVNDAVFYRDFLYAVTDSAGATYHTASPPPANRTIAVKGIDVTVPASVRWDTFSEGDVVELGEGARFTLLHAEAKAHPDPNQNSIVIALELGRTRVLLTGDAESGPRADPAAALGDVEAHLVDQAGSAIDVDILQVGHHGSKTSSRRAFLAAVSPSLALVSAGPKLYKGTRLPDPEVIAALDELGATVLRTDLHDDGCPSKVRLGSPTGPGGCDSYVITIEP